VSTWVRTASNPFATAQSQYFSARVMMASWTSVGFNSPHSAMPSSSVPDSLILGNPYDKVASI
jgi:hypothetical protein